MLKRMIVTTCVLVSLTAAATAQSTSNQPMRLQSAPRTSSAAITTPNQAVEIGGRRLAFRTMGSGVPIILCTRYRGTMDDWDPAFLDALIDEGFRVITFDYSGLGLSTGARRYDANAMANDARDLADALGLKRFVIGGWSLGGLAAQVVVARYPDRLTHAVLIGTGPAGALTKPAEQIFVETATKPHNTLADETVLFFEPASAASRDAARQSAERIAARTHDRSVPVPADWAATELTRLVLPGEDVLQALKRTTVPILHVGGDHDISVPVENWYLLNRQLPTVQLLTFPSAGHGPQHEHPRAVAEHIGTFIRASKRQN